MGVAAVLLAVAFSAFSYLPIKKGTSVTDFTWAKTNLDGTIPSNPDLFFGTAAEAQSHFSCPEGSTYYCAKAVDENNDPIPGGPIILRSL